MGYYYSSKALCVALALAMAAAAVGVITPCAAQNSPQDFVKLHNVARAAVGVGPVSWDEKVAAFARSYAAQRKGDCAMAHSGGGPSRYGENIFWGGRAWNASDAVGNWVAERKHYHYNNNSCSAPRGLSCLHYTQVVCRRSTAIGCARVLCNNGGVFVTCNYSPAGNVRGQKPY